MSLIEWKESFSVGVAAVDAEHRDLIELINDLHGLISDGADRDEVVAALGQIFAQISGHFALEERYMRDTKYDEFEAHKGDHENLLDQLRDIMDRVEDDGSYDEVRLAGDLEQWFTVHFRTHDARLHRHAAVQGSQLRT
ncbi:MAG: hemerythrin family protein [Gammaproteobacteria bacterium]|nr:hemerythrin family protein [Gammaproteobacteria bacterium]MDH4254376.1 hemerythrin family protein [Gammaproteobacteria bacterium]MDH5311315.1 hemerythrin family protein [Gammaproteobacteria bacterium]